MVFIQRIDEKNESNLVKNSRMKKVIFLFHPLDQFVRRLQ